MYAPAERKRALRALTQLFTAPEFRGHHELAQADFWPDWVSRLTDGESRRVAEVSRESQAIYLAWIAFDYEFADGRPLVDILLDVRGDPLTQGERDFLRRVRESCLGVYEITDVRYGEGLTLRDLWSDQVVRVRERKGSRQVVRWDVVAARLIPYDSKQQVMEGSVLAFPALAAEEILRELRSAHKDFKRRFPGGDHKAFFKQIGPLLHDTWLDEVVLRPQPRFVTPEGDPLVFARVTFELLGQSRLAARLAGHPEVIRRDETTYEWVERTSDGSPRRSLATFAVEGRRLVLEAMSKQRAARGRRLLEELAGGAVRFRSEQSTDADEVVRRLGESGGKQEREEPVIPPEIEARLAAEYYEQHYRNWLDTSLPVLGGRTPRHAAKLKTMRPRVIALLKDFESRAERQRREGRPAYDFDWMWDALGLDRP